MEARPPPPVVSRAAARRARAPQRMREVGARERASILWPQREPIRVSSPQEPAEREAEATARTVMQMSAGRVWPPGAVARAAHRTHYSRSIHRQAVGPPAVDADVSREIETSLGSGAPLPADVREFMEPRFRADFGEVRIHTDEQAERLSARLSARAFAYGKDIYFGRGQYRPNEPAGAELLAHELTHTIQQRAVVQRFTSISTGDAHEHEAQRASEAAVRGEPFIVSQQTSPRPQGIFGIDISLPDPLNWLANKANIIPGFRMFTIILGVNPINMSGVDRSAANILRALIEFLPGGGLITQALDSSGVFEKAGAFVEKQIATLGMTGAAIKTAVTDFIKGLSIPGDLLRLDATWERAKRIFTDPIDRIKSFGIGLVTGIVQLVKDAILLPIAKLAEGTEGYNLLKGVLGKDPITGTPVERSAETLLGPIMKMAGQGEIWEKMQQAKAIPRCWAWFKGVIPQLLGFVSQIPSLFISAFKSLTLEDIVLVPKAFAKLAGVFGGFIGKFVSWALTAIWNLLEIVFDVVSPGALGYIKKTGAALKSILKNPLPFVGNLVKAAKLGFTNFGDHFLDHLKTGLLDWLTGSLPGVYIPKALSLPEFGKFALSVLGISWAQIRGKIVKTLGPNGEKIMQGLELAFNIVKALVTGGPAAAWEVIKEKLTGLKDTIVDGIIGFIKDAVITKAIPKLIAMFIPGAGFISAIISIYDTVMVFVQKIAKIIQVVIAFIDSIVAIAAGNIGAAAGKVEGILAGLLSLAINFLAGFVGLGKVADKILGVIAKVREKVDKALDAAIAWIVAKAKSLFAKLFGKDKDKDKDPEKEKKIQAGLQALDAINAQYQGGATVEQLQGPVAGVKQQHPVFTSLSVIGEKDGLVYDYTASPGKKKKGPIDGNRAYNVGTHTVDKPDGVKMAGESHHVPAKVLQNWIGEILVVAGKETDNPALQTKGAGMVADKIGTGLSAIWLSQKNHDAAHESSASKPGDFDSEKNEIIVQTRAGTVSSRPMRTTIAGTVHKTAMDSEGSDADTKKKMNKEIYAKFSPRLKSLFTRVHAGLLSTGIAGVQNANLQDGKWEGKLKSLAKSTWSDKLDPKA
jgi:hypothetical protein